jgi:hypothetical protein
MKKLLVILGILLLLTGCSLIGNKEEKKTFTIDGYGTFTISDNYMIREDHSTKDKPFFVDKKDEHASRPNNISTNGGTNYYAKGEVLRFKDAITYQMTNQAKAYKAQLNGSGSKTDQGYDVLTFIMTTSTEKTVQYYIVGDYKYFLVHATIFDSKEEDSVIEAAEYIVNSFTWEE